MRSTTAWLGLLLFAPAALQPLPVLALCNFLDPSTISACVSKSTFTWNPTVTAPSMRTWLRKRERHTKVGISKAGKGCGAPGGRGQYKWICQQTEKGCRDWDALLWA